MAKNTSSSAFRKIDVDQYNEDNYNEEEAEQSMPAGPDENEVCGLLNHVGDRSGHESAKRFLRGDVHRLSVRIIDEGQYLISCKNLSHVENYGGRYVEALHLVLSNAPLGSSNQQVKDNALALTLKVLLTIKSTQIEDAVSSLSKDDVDILMKYIYRGFEYPSEGSSGHLLLWHEKAYNIGGTGSIVRVLADRMRV